MGWRFLPRLPLRLTSEGWHYVLVLCFVWGGALIRGINLLIVLGGVLLAPLLVGAFMARRATRKLVLTRNTPYLVQAGQRFLVRLSATNMQRWLAAWAIAVEDRVTPLDPDDRQADAAAVGVLFPYLAPQAQATASYEACLPRRGRYLFGPLLIRTRFPLGLTFAERRMAGKGEMIVGPAIGTLRRTWGETDREEAVGAHQARANRGNSEADFYGLRLYQRGDSRRRIHARASAKRGEIVVRQFEPQRNQDLALLLDFWRDGAAYDDNLRTINNERLELAARVAATLATHACARAGRRFWFCLAGDTIRRHSAWASPALLEEILTSLALARPAAQAVPLGTAVPTGALSELAVALSESPLRTPWIVVSTRPAWVLPSVGSGELSWIDVGSAGLGEWYEDWRLDKTSAL